MAGEAAAEEGPSLEQLLLAVLDEGGGEAESELMARAWAASAANAASVWPLIDGSAGAPSAELLRARFRALHQCTHGLTAGNAPPAAAPAAAPAAVQAHASQQADRSGAASATTPTIPTTLGALLPVSLHSDRLALRVDVPLVDLWLVFLPICLWLVHTVEGASGSAASATQEGAARSATSNGASPSPRCILGLAGCAAAGKTTTSQLLKAILAILGHRWVSSIRTYIDNSPSLFLLFFMSFFFPCF